MTESGFNPEEKYQSQIPAIQTLVALGFKPLSQPTAEKMRGRLRNVLLEDVLVQKLLDINRFNFRGQGYPFDLEDAHEALRRLNPHRTSSRVCAAPIKTFMTFLCWVLR